MSDITPDKFDPRLPGEVIVRIRPEIQARIEQQSDGGSVFQAAQAELPERFGIEGLDDRLKDLQASQVRGKGFPGESGRATRERGGYYRVRFDPTTASVEDAVGTLAGSGDVLSAEPNYLRFSQENSAPSSEMPWAFAALNFLEGWSTIQGEEDVIVAVVDSGVQLNHPDLQGALIQGRDVIERLEDTRLPHDYIWDAAADLGDPDNEPDDYLGHGSHIAGIVVGARNGAGGSGGLAQGCSVMPIRALAPIINQYDPASRRACGSAWDIAQGIGWAAARTPRPRVINMSFGFSDRSSYEKQAIEDAAGAGCILIAAAGNERETAAFDFYPALYRDTISVGAIDEDGEIADYSQRGAQVDFVAPGSNIVSAWIDSDYRTLSGTSMAAAFVSACVAVALSRRKELRRTQVVSLLRETASDTRPDFGLGRIDFGAVMERLTLLS
jgi:subtilisin family serine protease